MKIHIESNTNLYVHARLALHVHFFILLIFSVLTSCKNRELTIANYKPSDITEILDNNKIDSTNKNICRIIRPDCDSILIVSPYTPESYTSKLNLSNYSTEIEELLNKQEINESTNTLILVKNKNIIGYSVLPTSLVGFTYSNQNENTSRWISNRNCNEILYKSTFSNQNKSYIIYIK